MPQTPTFNSEQKLDLILFLLIQQQVQITSLQENVSAIMTEQADFNTDIQQLTADLTPIFQLVSDLPAQLTAIQTALANQGVTDVSPLDNLVQQANAVAPNVASLQNTLSGMPGGSPSSTSPSSPAPTQPGQSPT